MEPDLFSSLAYPNVPGAWRSRTSRAAAEAVKPRAATLRGQVLAMLKAEALTADEVAARMKRTVLCIRPRLSELVKKELIFDTGNTRPNASGIAAVVWKSVPG